MTIFYKALSSLIVVIILGMAASAQDPAPFTLSIKVDEPSVKAGAEIIVHITLKNTSTDRVIIYRDKSSAVAERMGFVADIRDAKKKAVPLTEYGRMFYNQQLPISSILSPFVVEPGKTLELSFTVSKFYDMSQPGDYTIQIERQYYKTLATSNKITVTVTPATP